MKKTKMILITLIGILLLSGCGQKAEATSFEDQLKSPNKIVIGISPDYPPFESLTTKGKIEGFDVDLIHTLVSYLDKEFEVELAQMEFSTIVTAVQTGQVDLGVSGFTYDPDRDVIFSTPYITSAQVVVIKAGSEIQSAQDLKGKTVGAQLGATGAEAASTIEEVKEVITFNDNLVGFESLNNGIIDAYVTDLAVAEGFANTTDYVILSEALVDESMSIIIKNGNDLLADKVNELIEQFRVSEEYQQLIAKWGV